MLRNIQVTDGWHVVRLSDVAMLGSGKSPRYRNDNGNVTVFGANGPIGFTDTSNFANGIAVGRVGASGSVHCVRAPVWLSDNVLSVEPHPEVLNLSFLYYVLVWAHLPALASKTAQPLLTQTELGTVRLPLPPLPEQRAIAAVLDSIDEAIERTEAVIAATERLRESLLHELLTRGVPGWHTEWTEVRGIGTIPSNWDVVRLGDVAAVQTGRAVNRKATGGGGLEIHYLSVANVKDGYLDLSIVKTMVVSEREIVRYQLRDGDVLFTEGGDADKLGRGTVWHGEIPLCLHQNHVFAVRPHEKAAQSEFLTAYASSAPGKRYFLGAAKQTTNLASINSTQLKQMLLPLPSIREQAMIVEVLAVSDETIEQARTEKYTLNSLKASVADALLTARVRVAI